MLYFIIIYMNARVKILLLGLMIWVLRIVSGGITFTIGNPPFTGFLISSIELFFITFGLVISISQVFDEKGQDYKRTGLEAGIIWYLILVLLELIFSVTLFKGSISSWYPSIFKYFYVLIIPILIGRMLTNEGKS